MVWGVQDVDWATLRRSRPGSGSALRSLPRGRVLLPDAPLRKLVVLHLPLDGALDRDIAPCALTSGAASSGSLQLLAGCSSEQLSFSGAGEEIAGRCG